MKNGSTSSQKRKLFDPINKAIAEYMKSSITRVCVLLVTLTGCFCAVYGLMTNKDLYGLSIFVGVIFGSAFGGKFFNKKLEIPKGEK